MNGPEFGPALKKFVKLIDELADVYNKHIFENKNPNTKEYKETLKKYDSMTVHQFLEQSIPEKHVR